jgi:hypothetical protein
MTAFQQPRTAEAKREFHEEMFRTETTDEYTDEGFCPHCWQIQRGRGIVHYPAGSNFQCVECGKYAGTWYTPDQADRAKGRFEWQKPEWARD